MSAASMLEKNELSDVGVILDAVAILSSTLGKHLRSPLRVLLQSTGDSVCDGRFMCCGCGCGCVGTGMRVQVRGGCV